MSITPRLAVTKFTIISASHAIATRGGLIIFWLIGVDEKKGGTSASVVDLASWYPQVKSQFDGLAPDMTPVKDKASLSYDPITLLSHRKYLSLLAFISYLNRYRRTKYA